VQAVACHRRVDQSTVPRVANHETRVVHRAGVASLPLMRAVDGRIVHVAAIAAAVVIGICHHHSNLLIGSVRRSRRRVTMGGPSSMKARVETDVRQRAELEREEAVSAQ
jgi:hypothetical protein